MRTNRFVGVVLSASALFAMVACGGSSTSDIAPGESAPNMDGDATPQLGTQQSGLNIINASTDAALDIYINGKRASDCEYRHSTGFLKVEGDVRVDIRLKGAAETSDPIATTNLKIAAKARVSLAVVGRAGAEGDGGVDASVDASIDTKLRLVVLSEGAVVKDAVKLRVLHASPSTASLDVRADANVVAHALGFGTASDYAALNADLKVGTKLGLRLGDANLDAALAATVKLHAKGSVLTAIAFGEILPGCADDRFLGIGILDEETGILTNLNLNINVDGPKSSFYLFNGTPDLGGIDIAVRGGAAIHTNLGYEKASPIFETRPGVLPLELRNSSSLSVVLGVNLKVLPGTHWALYTTGLADAKADVRAKLSIKGAVRLNVSAGSRIRFVNDIFDAPAVDVYAGANVWARGLLSGRVSAHVNVASDLQLLTLNVKISATLQALLDSVLSLDILNLGRDKVSTCFLTGAIDRTLGKTLNLVTVVESLLRVLPLEIPTVPTTDHYVETY